MERQNQLTNEPGAKRSLALLGGRPAFAEPLHVGRPNIANRARFESLLAEMFERNWLTNNGPLVREFERRIAAELGVSQCIAVCNATIGLELAIRAAGLQGEVLVPSYTFVATAHALQWQEITPVFVDIDATSHTMDPVEVERHITPRTSGILATHLWGGVCDVEALQAVARRRGLKLIFDAAHAFGCSVGGRKVGGFGDAEVFSFHATKFLNSFEGGAITTNDGELANRIRLMKNFGFKGVDRVVHLGTNGKMTEVCAAMGLSNLERLDELVAANVRNHRAYAAGLAGLPGLRLRHPSGGEASNYQYIVIEVDRAEAFLTRDELIAVLHAENVLARKYFWPGCHRMEPYASYYPDAGLLLPRTDAVAARVMVLPTGLAVTEADILCICELIATALSRRDDVRRALTAIIK